METRSFWPSSLGWEQGFMENEIKLRRGANLMITVFFF